MGDYLFLDWDDDLAAVKRDGEWRFYVGYEPLFKLDYTKCDSDYAPQRGGFRFGTLIVDDDNAAAWLSQLTEIQLVDLPRLAYQGSQPLVPLRFVIDFDEKRWVGFQWQNDQSALHEYQPDGWQAIEAETIPYLPENLRSIWTSSR